MAGFDGKKVIIIGDRDGIPGPAVEECLKGT
ncbi:MAG: glycine/sarcosine/betaine reductase complex selenoprotein A, partial [Candidatus Alkaliphilus sp. MAG34]